MHQISCSSSYHSVSLLCFFLIYLFSFSYFFFSLSLSVLLSAFFFLVWNILFLFYLIRSSSEDSYRYQYSCALRVSVLALNQFVDVHKLTSVSLLINVGACVFQIITFIQAHLFLSRWPSRKNFRNIVEILRSHGCIRYELLDRVISSGCCDIQACVHRYLHPQPSAALSNAQLQLITLINYNYDPAVNWYR